VIVGDLDSIDEFSSADMAALGVLYWSARGLTAPAADASRRAAALAPSR
jgi:hypothetical protein